MTDINEVITNLSRPNILLNDEDQAKLEVFVIKMYSKDNSDTALDEARKTMIFEKGCQLQQLPSTSATLKIIPCVLCIKLDILGDNLLFECKT